MSVTGINAGPSTTNPSPAQLADAQTPLIRNAWYVVAASDEITRTPLGRDVMETSLVLYRSESGEPIALANRCCHRSFPLASGKVEGDTLRCGYHGLRYDAAGRCVEIPMQPKIPQSVRVRAYPVVERRPFVWIWFGDPELADESTLPHPDWLGHEGWDLYMSYLPIGGSYVHLHENLLDLSHLTFLHETTFGTPEYARAPVELKVEGTNIEAWRHVECSLPDIYAVPLKWQGQKVLRSSGSRFIAPGLHVNTGILKNLEIPETEQQPIATIKVAQIITPQTKTRTHYWFAGCRNFVRNRPDIDEFMCRAQIAAFSEDRAAIENIARVTETDQAGASSEVFIPTDGAGIAMRRHLYKLAASEAN